MSAVSSSFLNLVLSLNRAAKRRLNRKLGMVIAVSDVQWGDCGKAAVLSYVCELLIQDDITPVAVRFQGGSNAGHTVWINGTKFVTHLIPVSVLYGGVGLIGPNCVILPFQWGNDLPGGLLEEIQKLQDQGTTVNAEHLIIDPDASVTCPWHIELERLIDELGGGVGSTKRGIAPTYESVAGKWRITVQDCLSRESLSRAFEQIRPHLKLRGLEHMLNPDTFERLLTWGKGLQHAAKIARVDRWLHEHQKKGGHILLEGAQGAHLDVLRDSPCSTSSSPWPAIGLGQLQNIIHIGVFKLVPTRVGEGPFPTEVFGEEADRLRNLLGEYGSTTGRPRRIGMPLMSSVREGAARLGVDILCLTKGDLLVGERLEAYDCLSVNGYAAEWWASQREAWDKAHRNQCSGGIAPHRSFQLPVLDRPFTGVREWRKLPREAQELVIALQERIPVPIAMMKTGPGSFDMVVRSSH